eukprot:GHUV01025198.1.p1 GENE.GHUV01025198.1~~GHUV01025198.1.p1  ORF type:complete len:812 (+),score=246.94 GHUV01025198.1:450-2885(+)
MVTAPAGMDTSSPGILLGGSQCPTKQQRLASNDSEKVAARHGHPQPTWSPEARPAGAEPPVDAGFVLEDERLAGLCGEQLAGNWCVSDQRQPDSTLLALSTAFESLTGYTAEELAGKPLAVVLQGTVVQVNPVNQSMCTVDMTVVKKDLQSVPVQVYTVPIADSSREPWLAVHLVWSSAISSSSVPSKQPQMEQATGSSGLSEQVQHCVGSGAVCMVAVRDSTELLVSSCSQRFASLTGYSEADLCGSSFSALLGPETSSSTSRAFFAAQLAGKAAVAKLLVYKKDGTPFWALAASCPVATQPASPSSQQQQLRRAQHHLVLLVNITAKRPHRVGKYYMGRVLGQGASGIVRLGKNTATGELVAIKAVDATRFHTISEIEQVQEEMAVTATLKHPNIIRLLEVHFVSNCFYFVMERASMGSMMQYIHSQGGGKLLEKQAQQLFGQIFSALEYCHKRRVIHRDLKPENILMEGDTPKIADFGLAGVMSTFSGTGFTLQCGTPEFSAPEIVRGSEYEGQAVDLWSVGIMLYEALSGDLPFKGSSQAALFKAIQRGAYQPLPQTISPEARDLVTRLLLVDPAARITWSELSRHPWLNGTSSSDAASLDSDVRMARAGCSCKAAVAADSLHSYASSHVRIASRSGKSDGVVDAGDIEASTGSHKQRENADAEPNDEVDALLSGGHLGVAGGDSFKAGAVCPSALASAEDSLQLAEPAMAGSCHDSVRVVIPSGNLDDLITAAIRQRLGAVGGSGAGDSSSVCSDSSSGHASPSSRAYSLSGTASPAGGTRLIPPSKSSKGPGNLLQGIELAAVQV